MVRREKKFYSKEFKERALTAYQNSNESVSMIAQRYGISRDTFSGWVYRKRTSFDSQKSDTFTALNSTSMKKKEMSQEEMSVRINELEHQLSLEKMRAESFSKMIDIAERELKIDIRKKTGAKQSLR
jgi:transposase-like protein